MRSRDLLYSIAVIPVGSQMVINLHARHSDLCCSPTITNAVQTARARKQHRFGRAVCARRMLYLLTLGAQTFNKVPGINAMLEVMFDEGNLLSRHPA